MSQLLNLFVNKEKIISVTGLGYVGLPLALEFAKHFKQRHWQIKQKRKHPFNVGDILTFEFVLESS